MTATTPARPNALPIAPVPAHVPSDRVYQIDAYDRTSDSGVDFAHGWKALHAQGLPDVLWTTGNGGHWIVTRAALMDRILTDNECFSARYVMAPRERNLDPPLLPVQADPPDWIKYRVFFNRALAPKAVESLEVHARRLARELIDDLMGKGRCDFISEFSYHLPITVFLHIAGLPLEDREYLLGLVHGMMRLPQGDRRDAVYGELASYALRRIEERRGGSGKDALTDMANGLVDGKPIPTHTLIGMANLLLMAGLDTVAGMMGFFMWHLARHPEHRRYLLDHPERIPDAVEELLRRYSITTNARVLVQDVEFDGVTLKAGEIVVFPLPLHGLDERRYRNPLEVDFERRPRHSAFSGGVHRCAGASLARAELRILLEEWLPRIPDFEIDPDGRITMAGTAVASLTALPLMWPARCRS
ncbi:MAG: cytochrome P450 [Gammaproteobacteria bacterium]